MSLSYIKAALRRVMLAERDLMEAELKKKSDEALLAKISEILKSRNATTVHTYLPMGSEIDLRPLINSLLKDGITVVAPRSLQKPKLQHLVLQSLQQLDAGPFGTSHPAQSSEYTGSYDVIIVPGLAFDQSGYRLGYGAGYYDHFLAEHPKAFKIGLCYPFQVIEKVPVETHDIKVDHVIVP